MGKTILISSHILPELSEVCTSIGIIERGKMVVSGTVEEIMSKMSHKHSLKIKVLGSMEPAVRFLKEQTFIGSIKMGNDHIIADYEGKSELLADMLKNMVKSDIPIVSFAEVEDSLETIFMHVTGGVSSAAN